MKKRVYKLGVAAIVGVFALSACGGNGNDNGNDAPADDAGSEVAPADLETTIKILAPSYSDSSKADWDAITKKFNEEYPKVTVELQIDGWENFSQTVQSRIQANDYPDILNDNAFSSSAEADLLYPIDELLSEETISNIDAGLLANGEGPDGTQWAAPDIASARMLVYNTDLFEQAGVAEAPKTWEDLEAAAEKITALGDDIYAYGMPLGAEEAQVESSLWVWGAGGNWTDGENLKADSDVAVEGFTQMKKMYDAGYTQPNLEDDRQDTTDLLAAGKLAMAIGHGQVVGDATAKGINVALAPIPSKDGEGVAIGVTDFIVAFNNDDAARKQATAAYLDVFYSDEVYEPWYKGTGLLPVTTSTIEKGKAEAEGNEAAFLDALSVVKFQPVSNPQWDALQTALQANAYKIGTEEPAALLEQIEAQVAAQS
ncbi:extracellular solute-binding protein [Tessaracoccus sp. MC1865]|uniref:extracellular solute-binding protein n=1 Tax=Tessaracoccus sp. MC1865 TaxID=2760310 RepID=UPI0015FF9ADA|nr:extracellular solute-binding protein [Tessaracoccus sp. MC1865]MBB1484773.1 extracellular solute-binding protein [Tessaracoccus sp. MC1865]QTO36289.1 extracellular solute-binding protein [Tessaracoccus sp. MC1865]